jgi:hypothetical protein
MIPKYRAGDAGPKDDALCLGRGGPQPGPDEARLASFAPWAWVKMIAGIDRLESCLFSRDGMLEQLLGGILLGTSLPAKLNGRC